MGRDSKGWVGGSVLDARKRLIDGECTRQMFCALLSHAVALDTAHRSQAQEALAGDDSRDAVWANSLQRHQCDILLEGLCELDDA